MTVHRGVGEVLAEAGELTVRRLGRASSWQKTHGGTIERALLSTGAVTESVLTSALCRAYGLPGVARETLLEADPDVVACLSARARRRLRALPFDQHGKELFVAVSDPRNLVLLQNLVNDTGFAVVVLYVVPEPVLEDLLDHFDPAAALPGRAAAPPAVPPAPSAAATVEKEQARRAEPEDPTDRLGLSLLAAALRFGATELELGADTKGGFARTFDADRPALTRRISGALIAPLGTWLKAHCLKEGGFFVKMDAETGGVPDRHRVDLLASDPAGVRVRFTRVEETHLPSPGPRLACKHKRGAGFVFCPLCGEAL
jgi:Type II secretion system (T2SS), protein E, N-terminal domain